MKKTYLALMLPALLAACATVPTGPTVAVMPAPGKPFEVFAQEEQQCRAYASASLGTDTNQAAASNMAGSMALGTVVGAAAGALIGGNHQGAGVGAGVGMLAGTAAGSSTSSYAGYDAQTRYNISYQQCMYAKGNQLPSQARPVHMAPRGYYYPPPSI
ncbi:YMGG-like glycine zipper-containing protein [Chromobacterium sp. IIBBL 290-4]|uniref:YMGG-like glycine zipper-containing protein n=1 Tax=Chromobacterium sp. IIBBL 290-4 TaxID=2953890 RepID=UPI0020B81429|nr:YMGG-like glycine zipper-containing protein [Chromobacterium sp. IIBBL 290-4]UTH75956.1 YMGG-like glycine zipper-containing protein [Chromobacterium sp. IIBBL 290-4]